MRTYQESGSSVEDATKKFLDRMELKPHETYEVKVLDAGGGRGFLGLLTSSAKIEITIFEKEMPAPRAADTEHEDHDESGEEPYADDLPPDDDQTDLNDDSAPEGDDFDDESEAGDETPIHENRSSELPLNDKRPQRSKEILLEMIGKMGFEEPEIDVEYDQEANAIWLTVTGEDAGQLIGRRGRRMKALQHMVNITANHGHKGEYMRVNIDIEDYVDYRRKQLEKIADHWADRAIRSGQCVKLEPMDAYDRKIIHEYLSEDDEISTQSEGREPNRALVLIPAVEKPPQRGRPERDSRPVRHGSAGGPGRDRQGRSQEHDGDRDRNRGRDRNANRDQNHDDGQVEAPIQNRDRNAGRNHARGPDRSAGRDQEPGRDRNGGRNQPGGRDRNAGQNQEPGRGRNAGRDQEPDRDRPKSADRTWGEDVGGRDDGKGRGPDRERGREPDRGRGRGPDRDGGREPDRGRGRGPDRDGGRDVNPDRDRGFRNRDDRPEHRPRHDSGRTPVYDEAPRRDVGPRHDRDHADREGVRPQRPTHSRHGSVGHEDSSVHSDSDSDRGRPRRRPRSRGPRRDRDDRG